MDKYRIDSHKLGFHVGRVNDWLEGQTVYPIYMEISPSGTCNHRCTYCALDFMEYQRRFLETDRLGDCLCELGRLGIKSIMYAGEGEPLLHPQMAEIVQDTWNNGIHAALTTNGVLLNEQIVETILPVTEWIKVSINAGTAATYSQIHRCREQDFDKVIANLSRTVEIKRDHGYKCTLGMQIVLLPENQEEVTLLAGIARDIGMDYLVVKPYSQHPQSKTDQYRSIHYGSNQRLMEQLESFNTEQFQVIFRAHTMSKWDEKTKPYHRCMALPFWSYMDAGGNVWGCSMFLGDERFLYGNIYEESFEQIWTGSRRAESLQWVEQCLDPENCRVNCRMDEINRYLWSLRHPPAHVNFI
ncbi:MAG: radical SAM protein [Sedimentisphaerales bacterium]|nr:radical SAM protein [Sedimentisphaerales bacterium]